MNLGGVSGSCQHSGKMFQNTEQEHIKNTKVGSLWYPARIDGSSTDQLAVPPCIYPCASVGGGAIRV